MLTTTHVALNGALSRWSGSDRTAADGSSGVPRALRSLLPDHRSRTAIVVGGLAPDVGLAVLSLGAALWFPTVEGLTLRETAAHSYEQLFYEDPGWIVVHNVLHAPIVLTALVASGEFGRRAGRRWGTPLRAFAIGCLLHTVLDVATHVADGPLLLFPVDLETRFHSPVSYWDPAHHGDLVRPVDLAISVLGGGWLAATWTRRRWATATDARAS